jgi:5-methyltetrahydropteroyltriglutamate--homocysteine methyltransferase
VIASTDCGFGTFAGSENVAESVVWAKLAALVEGARLASARLWARRSAGSAETPPVTPPRRGA